MRTSAFLLAATLLLPPHPSPAQNPTQNTNPDTNPDTDQDGLPDLLEQSLLTQFAPTFLVGRHDCSNLPAEFTPSLRTPTLQHENGTIYGQVFPSKSSTSASPEAEIHFFHLWARDCGPHPHPLDTEHVAVLVRQSPDGHWKALYWYAAAHEDTVCDVSQITRASTLHAEDHGPRIWISPGKHASYLNETLCKGGCGADRCVEMAPLASVQPINLGEPGHPMNGSAFIASPAWPLLAKMEQTNFPAPELARLDRLPPDQISLYNPGPHPAQGIIAHSSFTESRLAAAANNTTGALGTAGEATQHSTGNALEKSVHTTGHALASALRHTRQAVTPK